MGSLKSKPYESNLGDKLRCIKCYKVLPPCHSFDDFYRAFVHGKYVYVFNRGQYYRPCGDNKLYECAWCFDKPNRDQQRREQERRREQKKRDNERKMKEQQMAREAQQKKRREELNHRLEETHQRAQEHHEKLLRSDITQDQETRQSVLISHQGRCNSYYKPEIDEFLEALSSRCSISIDSLSLAQLTVDEMGNILSVLEKLLFDEWTSAPPSLGTLQHAQVFITELFVLSLEIDDVPSLQNISDQLQSLVETVSQSACNDTESLELTQALFLSLMHFITEHSSSDTETVLIAKRWAGEDLSTEELFLIEFLTTLTSSLQDSVGRASKPISEMEIQCFKLVLFKLVHLDGKESHSKSTNMLLSLVQSSQWTPAEAISVLLELSNRYTEDAPISEVLMLVQVYDVPPDWTGDSGHSFIETLDFFGPERFPLEFQNTLRKQDETNLQSTLKDLKMFGNLDDSVIDMIRNITTGVLQYSKNAPKGKTLKKCLFGNLNMSAYDVQMCLNNICKAVFDTKGLWPTVPQMVMWCVSVLMEEHRAPELVGVGGDPCVMAMFVATKVFQGHKLDLVMSSDGYSQKQIEDWFGFYKHLNISVNTNRRQITTSQRKVYEADVVYGAMEDFISDYFQFGLEGMEIGRPHPVRGFIIDKRSVSTLNDLKLLRLLENNTLMFSAEMLQSLINNFQNEDMETRSWFVKALFQLFQVDINKHKGADKKILTILQKCTAKDLPFNKVYPLTFLENLLKTFTQETKHGRNEALQNKLYMDSLFVCAIKSASRASKELMEKLFQMVSNLLVKGLWSPAEALQLLVVLTDYHYDEACVSIMKILQLMETYQVSSKWMDGNGHSLELLLNTHETEDLILHLEDSFRDEKIKSMDILFDELLEMNHDEHILKKTYHIVNGATRMIESREIKRYTSRWRARYLSHSTETKDLQVVLAVLCNAVHLNVAKRRWWPRATQMASWCLLALSDSGKLLEMGTGEGKSCVIAMFAALRALRGEKVDVVSSSSVLCQRDAAEWSGFYSYFGITVDSNTDKTTNEDRKKCYKKDVIYGTIETFAADHLRQIFEMKDVRPDRGFQCIIIDEVDSLLLDQGVQLTYLSSPMVAMQHLNVILSMIWAYVCQYGLQSTGHQIFIQGPPASFFKAVFDSIDTNGTGIHDAMDILHIAEETNQHFKGFTEGYSKNGLDNLLSKLKTVSEDAVVDFFQDLENYVHYDFIVYTLTDNGLLHLRKSRTYNDPEIQSLAFLVLEGGMCCALYDSENILIEPIAHIISEKIQYTPCTSNKDKISIPGFLRKLIKKKLPLWVQNAFLALRLRQGQEYVVENDRVCPVDFRSTGIIEVNKQWGDGLQQFVEMKHQIKLSTISTVTNFMSNISFFEKYHGQIYGTTGTLGSDTDMLFVQNLYPNLSACKMPTFNRRKLFEVKGTLTTSVEEWKSEIKQVVMAKISSKPYRNGRAALVICETINKAKEIHEELRGITTGDVVLYCRSDKDCLSKIEKELLPGDIIVATNLAGRGTDIKISKEVNNSGGLFVVLSFLPENTRVEQQAFGRTARKGEPGSAQIIMTTSHLQESFSRVSSLEEAKKTRDRLAAEKIKDMTSDIAELKLREDLFSEYCYTLQNIYRETDGDSQRTVVAIMNEYWGIWLQTKSEEITQLRRDELEKSLKADMAKAKYQCQNQTSPCCSIYHYIKFGNIAVGEKQWDTSIKLFEKAMRQDESWAAIAFYSHAYCTIKEQKEGYIDKALGDLVKAQESLKYFTEESLFCLQFVKMACATCNTDPTRLEKQLTTKCYMYSCFDKNISEAIKKLEEIKERGKDATAKTSSMLTLVPKAEDSLLEEADNLYRQGLEFAFSVEEKPQFPWGALAVFFLGILQIVGGALLTAFTFGGLAQVGVGLIIEGVSDCITGIQSMVTGEFSWKSYAIEKAISIGISMVGFGVGKLIAKGFKATQSLAKGLSNLKSTPKYLSKQAKDGLSAVAKTNMRNAAKLTAKKIASEVVMYGIGEAENQILKQILNQIKKYVTEGIADEVKSTLGKNPLAALVDSIILSHLEDEQQLYDLLQDEDSKNRLLDIFKKSTCTALKPFYSGLDWQSKLNSSICKVIDNVKSETKGKISSILTAIQIYHLTILATDAISTVHSLSDEFFSNLQEELNELKTNPALFDKVKRNRLSYSEREMLKSFRQDLADTISNLLADALVVVFDQKFSSHLVSLAQSSFNRVIGHHVGTFLKTSRTEEKLKAGQNNCYIAHMSGKQTGQPGTRSQSHAERITNPQTAGTLLDIRVLSETTGTKVVILTPDSRGHLTKMQELTPNSKFANQTVTLIYRPKSDQYPDGHYDVRINNKTVNITNDDKNCLFKALSTGLKPGASEKDIALETHRLRIVEAKALREHPGQWEPFIKRKEWTEAIRGGDWFMAEGGVKSIKFREDKTTLKNNIGQVGTHKQWSGRIRYTPGMGQVLNGDHQPAVSCVVNAYNLNPKSKLAVSMLEVATNSYPLNQNLIPEVKKNHGANLPTVCVPADIHREFGSTISAKFREMQAEAISKDNVVDSFKLVILGSIHRGKLNTTKNFKKFQNNNICRLRLHLFEDSFQNHSKNIIQKWFDYLGPRGVMKQADLKKLHRWIDAKGYDNPKDPLRQKVSNIL